MLRYLWMLSSLFNYSYPMYIENKKSANISFRSNKKDICTIFDCYLQNVFFLNLIFLKMPSSSP